MKLGESVARRQLTQTGHRDIPHHSSCPADKLVGIGPEDGLGIGQWPVSNFIVNPLFLLVLLLSLLFITITVIISIISIIITVFQLLHCSYFGPQFSSPSSC